MKVRRRHFVGYGLLATLAGFYRRVWAQASSIRYHRLARPALVPLADLATPWRARMFVTEGVTLSSAPTPNQTIRVAGMVVRTAAGNNEPDRFSAVCARCPHEGCEVDFMADPNQLPQEVKDEIEHAVEKSVYVCPCHNSVFLAEDGARIAGPAPRGLYHFRIGAVSDASIEIAEVEEDVLIFS